MKEYFSGNKDLFKGLKIDGLEKEWTKYPVISLPFAKAKTANEEVKSSTAKVLAQYTYEIQDTAPLKKAYIDFSKDDDIDKFIEHLKIYLEDFPFSLNNMNEKHYHAILYTLLTSFGANVIANRETALGKADLVLYMPKSIYVIELKYEQSVESAKKQIRRRRYAAAYLDSGKKIVKLAIKFSEKERNIVEYEKAEEK